MSIKQFFWLVPFCSFLAGYMVMAFLYPAKKIHTPNVVGMSTSQALQVTSDENITVRIIAHKQELDLPPGTIISQTPAPGSALKQYQTIYCVISTQPEEPLVPPLIGMHTDEIIHTLQAQKLKFKLFYLNNTAAHHTCIAQSPQPGAHLAKGQAIILYISNGAKKPIIWPNFRGVSATQVQEFLSQYNIPCSFNHTNLLEPGHTCSQTCVVKDQRPLAGSIISLDTSLEAKFQIEKIK